MMKVIMSWLFKDPIVTVIWLNFNHAQSNSKKWLWCEKAEIAPNEIFSQKKKKKKKKVHVTISPFHSAKILKQFLKLIQSYEDVPFSGTKWHICPEQFFLGTNHYYYSHLPVGPFHCAKFTKTSYKQSKFVRMPHFWAQNGPFAPNSFFL